MTVKPRPHRRLSNRRGETAVAVALDICLAGRRRERRGIASGHPLSKRLRYFREQIEIGRSGADQTPLGLAQIDALTLQSVERTKNRLFAVEAARLRAHSSQNGQFSSPAANHDPRDDRIRALALLEIANVDSGGSLCISFATRLSNSRQRANGNLSDRRRQNRGVPSIIAPLRPSRLVRPPPPAVEARQRMRRNAANADLTEGDR